MLPQFIQGRKYMNIYHYCIGTRHFDEVYKKFVLGLTLMDGFVIPAATLVYGGRYIRGSGDIETLVLNSVAVAFIPTIDDMIIQMFREINDSAPSMRKCVLPSIATSVQLEQAMSMFTYAIKYPIVPMCVTAVLTFCPSMADIHSLFA